mmetsp:Transcript_31213/g.62473  ORF Transcript_31213/g.62473 Transcript_31213/m.62473 type:complete len:291 (+) Transcript_31213:544-1416(+)
MGKRKLGDTFVIPLPDGTPVSFSLHAKHFEGLGKAVLDRVLRPSDVQCADIDLKAIAETTHGGHSAKRQMAVKATSTPPTASHAHHGWASLPSLFPNVHQPSAHRLWPSQQHSSQPPPVEHVCPQETRPLAVGSSTSPLPHVVAPVCHSHIVAPKFKAAYLELTDVSLWPCTWRRSADNSQGCSTAPLLTHPDAGLAEGLGEGIESCAQHGMGWVAKLPNATRGYIRHAKCPHAAQMAPDDVVLLIDVWAISIYHLVIESIFPAFVTLMAHFGQADACTSGKKCTVYLVS